MTASGFLLVDDDPLMLAMLEPRLKALDLPGISGVRGFHRPDHALEHLAKSEHPPVVVVSDYNLKANLNGLDLLRRIAELHPSTIRILMSGHSREQIGLQPDAPIDGFVEKELRVEDIVQGIVALVERARNGPRPLVAARAAPLGRTPSAATPRQAIALPAAPASPLPAHAQSAPADVDLFIPFIQSTQDFAIFALDPAGVVKTWNPGAERIKGWKAKEIIGRHFSTFYPPADMTSHKPHYILQRAAEDGRYEDEGWRIRKDGSMFWANTVVTSVRGPDGEIKGYVKVSRDLTARRHAEDAMRQSEERYRLFISSVKDYAMFVLDTTGHVMTWNEGAHRLKGYHPQEIVGKHFSVFYTQTDRDRQHPQEELALALRDGRYQEEGWRVRKDGSIFWAHVTITALFDADRKHVGFAKVTRDLTERRIAEQRLRERAEKYAELNRELDAFSHTVAHDLRAPVRAIQSVVEHILANAKSRLTEEDERSLRAIETSSRNMGVLIQDLLDLSRTARQEPQRTDVDLSQLAARILEEKKLVYPHHVIHASIEPDLHANVDERLVRVALSNLLDNAVKFAHDRFARVTFGREPPEEGGAFFVKDEGIGFHPEETGKLFQPFVRLHAGNDYPGTGIGLTIVERIVRRHGGRIWATGEPGRGTTFRFTLNGPPPLAHVPPPQKAP